MWQTPMKDHLRALKQSKLIDNLKTFQIGLVGPEDTRNEVRLFLDSQDVSYSICTEVDDGWEQETQDKIFEFAQDNDGYVLYAHTKNAVKINQLHVAWRLSMTYHNVIKWQDAVKNLDEGCSAVGCHYLWGGNGEVETVSGFFAGTYWWTHLKYIRNFSQKASRKNRFGAEGWIGYLKPAVEEMGDEFKICDYVPYHPIDVARMTTFW